MSPRNRDLGPQKKNGRGTEWASLKHLFPSELRNKAKWCTLSSSRWRKGRRIFHLTRELRLPLLTKLSLAKIWAFCDTGWGRELFGLLGVEKRTWCCVWRLPEDGICYNVYTILDFYTYLKRSNFLSLKVLAFKALDNELLYVVKK